MSNILLTFNGDRYDIVEAVLKGVRDLHPNNTFTYNEKVRDLPPFYGHRKKYLIVCTSKEKVPSRWKREANIIYNSIKYYLDNIDDGQDW